MHFPNWKTLMPTPLAHRDHDFLAAVIRDHRFEIGVLEAQIDSLEKLLGEKMELERRAERIEIPAESNGVENAELEGDILRVRKAIMLEKELRVHARRVRQ